MYRFSGADGKVMESDSLSSGDVLKSWKQDKGALAAKVNGQELDLDVVLSADSEVLPITAESEEGLDILRHSTAHLLAQAVTRLFPGSVVAIGPVIKDGFYYDIEFKEPISESDLSEIEKEMRRIVKKGIPIVRKNISREDAIALFRERQDPYKVEILEAIEDDSVNVYWQDEYVDLCRGPHAPNTRYLKYFKLLSVAGAYWRGDENNIMLTRIYGTAFASQEELEGYIHRMEEAKKRDHRKLGRELGLFTLHREGPGFPFFHPKGMVVINTLVDFWRKVHRKNGYDEIKTPLILNRDLWIQSGHWDHYRDNMYFTEIDEQPYAIKPMNCPGGIMVYKSDLHSYRELPLRLGELGTVHRHEKSGVLHGLMRVRCFTQDDAHHYCTPDQIKDEVSLIMDMVDYIYSEVFGFKYHIELSTRPENSMGSDELWTLAEDSLREVLERRGVKYILNPGDGAFYGPKIDFHLEDCIGRTWQCGTIQLDFQMPEKFDVNYIGPDGKEHRPAMLHRTILGSLERFFGILIEHYAGAFPFWIAPVQIKILAVGEDHVAYARDLMARLKCEDYRVELDVRDEKLGKKIRDAQMEKVPFMLVVGDKELESGTAAVRDRSEGDLGSMSFEDLLSHLKGQFSPL
ncbi:threonine--tRNA ligase [Dethiosulfovibrio salsuginis]|uniref:Threonine--tRNA ligase n=1 Tax=Dethiosulfovibrio salsuginis TaxID=561720 RepID=A0A1X7ITL5_9BACT|nr:threonine--tRNA ligase [Dethiosulfovibrio salsuginis]SMG18170.1 threonyl-tRNA synthetase [Dethiosulfovibrio salsuginis]